MSCNGCRVLRKGCSEGCVLRSCLHWIDSPESQGNATLFLAKFFGRSDLLSFISAVPDHQRPALFQSLLFEACGRTVNPVSGAVGLLSSGNWHVCQAAAETVLGGGVLRPIPGIDVSGNSTGHVDESSVSFSTDVWTTQNLQFYPSVPSGYRRLSDLGGGKNHYPQMENRRSLDSEESVMTSFGSGDLGDGDRRKERKLLNLFI
ncbi:LOB domain-containing protein 39-like [Momordica charantia]|uniref:LOB domain-containing protein 39-like n=1 Tax=Momordica charantia TaxID=3673 RepID=A0A6J1C6S3_MOMCH|nr:LOB domain-containing protein 39-like [Momordica charantia]